MYVRTCVCSAGSVMVSRKPTGREKEKVERERVRGALTAVASTRRHGVFSYDPNTPERAVHMNILHTYIYIYMYNVCVRIG